MPGPQTSADQLIDHLLAVSESDVVCILDSCGATHLGSHLLIAGVHPSNIVELSGGDVGATLDVLNDKLRGSKPCIFTLSYDFGRRMLGVGNDPDGGEPDVFLAEFDSLIIHDYNTGETFGVEPGSYLPYTDRHARPSSYPTQFLSNVTHAEYLASVETIRESIRAGYTYQTNLTHQLRGDIPAAATPQEIFKKLREENPAPFAAFLTRPGSTVVSASPERFFAVDENGTITTSPIKGTRPRGQTPQADKELAKQLTSSGKDIAENTMIVDLLRNDLGRVCEYGSVAVDKLCELEEHPTYFNLVSTVSGKLRADAKPADILKAMFPCGSITGAPKISTMKIIDEIENAPRGLSMGAIGCYIPAGCPAGPRLDLSVAIRTMVIRDGHAVFNVGGGITIGSDPESEWQETLVKAEALLNAFNAEFVE